MNRIRQTCKDLIDQRGYTYVSQGTGEDDLIYWFKCEFQGDTVTIYISKTPKFNNTIMDNYLSIMNTDFIDHAIIIYRKSITSSVKNIENFLNKRGSTKSVELFEFRTFLFNVTKHILQPKFERSDDQFKGKRIPLILQSDPVVRFMGYKKNEVIKITRKNGYVTFRRVS